MRTRIGIALALGASALIACTARSASVIPTTAAVADPCLVVPPPTVPLETVTVVVEERGYPSDSAFREMRSPLGRRSTVPAFALAQVYAPLVRATCDDRIEPGLAERWTAGPEAGSWTFDIRPGAHFADGTPVTAQAVIDDWTRRALAPIAITFRPFRRLTASAERTLTVQTGPQTDGLRSFAHPLFSVGGRDSSGTWSIATGAFAPDGAASTEDRLVLNPGAGRLPTIVLRSRRNDDERDLLDGGVDLLQTRDLDVVEYARRTGAFDVYPLPWDRTYALAVPYQDRPPPLSWDAAPGESAVVRGTLARHAARAEARSANAPDWWRDPRSCVGYPPMPRDGAWSRENAGRTIQYSAGDPTSRALAERIVAIARDTRLTGWAELAAVAPELTRAGPPLVAAARESAQLGFVATAYVVAFPHRVTSRCFAQGEYRLVHSWGSTELLIPLIDTRSFLIARHGAPAVTVDWDGTLRVHASPTVHRTP